MPGHASTEIPAAELLSALGALAVAQEEDRPSMEISALTGDVLRALDDFHEARGELAA